MKRHVYSSGSFFTQRLKTVVTLLASAVLLAPAAARSSAPRKGDLYVSMGSSYAAGPGVGTPVASSGGCRRSESNFADIVARERGLKLVDVSCSGATTGNILDHGQYGLPAQIEAVTPDARLVSILIGGNDVNYVADLMGLSCRDTGGANCRVTDPAEVERRLAILPESLDRVVMEVRRRAPAARIVLLGYLPAVPGHAAVSCAALPLAPDDAARMRALYVRLAQIIGGAARRNGIDVVPSSVIGAGHDACSEVPYVAGYHPPQNPGWAAPVAYHPNQAGMNKVAEALNEVIGDSGAR
ncbi:SGNH/GDSL hydrolase family protein [Acetobacter sp. DsW_063]|uniref:SGNH/GDSL hydrolase family protein n=1 Tax=Acetobacter sp. DsW_063 TaxID=1514894 RepID=UPI000B68C826|nr:SGNH/GDSL hydrolase family protein [Acetobacter sp. DsW_063]OUJ14311.1 hypothetical protein HK28_14030 [Acetobacter sp. DsW_063]